MPKFLSWKRAVLVLLSFFVVGSSATVTEDLLNGAWTPGPSLLQPLPPARSFHGSSAVVSERFGPILCLYGGWSRSSGALSDVWTLRSGTILWQNVSRTDPWPMGRCGHGFAALSNEAIIAVGGSKDCSAAPLNVNANFADVWLFFPLNATWLRLPDLPAARAGAGVAAADGGRVVVSGGVDSEGQLTTTLFVLDALNGVWRTIEPSAVSQWPVARAFGAMVRVAGHAYLHGGCGANGTVLGSVWRLAFAPSAATAGVAEAVWSHILSSSQGPVRCGHAATALGGSLAIVGGLITSDIDSDSSSSELWVLEALTGEWARGPSAPLSVYGHSIAAFACDDCRSTLPAVLAVSYGLVSSTQSQSQSHSQEQEQEQKQQQQVSEVTDWAPLLFVPGAALEAPPSVWYELAPLAVIAAALTTFGGVLLWLRCRRVDSGVYHVLSSSASRDSVWAAPADNDV